ncbi:plasmid mobilization protein [Bradyrhizobium japonicum]|uniref:plasmid mobilization protein n=1 Tax=Bradyrhizobium japonicum TaxID=375 RepID=UPI0004BB99D0|nr:plasmid mobilization relaxosome protein MobC [Bradyrhizobium japonicum]
MARPRKGTGDQLSEMLRCRLKPAEYLRVRQAAQQANMSVSDYMRRMLLTGTVTVKKTKDLDPATFDQLRRIGVNLNQAVHKLHATGLIPPELARAASAVEKAMMVIVDAP